MSASQISQREARRLRKRVEQLECERAEERRAWSREYPGGVNIDSFQVDAASFARVETAIRLGHAVVVTATNKSELRFYALPLPEQL